MQRIWIALGALAGLLAVGMAAVVAHATPDPAAQTIAARGVEMQGWHALALLAVGLWAPRGGLLAHAAGGAFVLGMAAFCGAVYAAAFSGLHLGMLAPAGGTLLMLGWALLGASALQSRG